MWKIKCAILTWDEYVLVRSADKLHRLLGVESEVLVNCVSGNILVCAIIKSNEDIQKHYSLFSETIPKAEE